MITFSGVSEGIKAHQAAEERKRQVARQVKADERAVAVAERQDITFQQGQEDRTTRKKEKQYTAAQNAMGMIETFAANAETGEAVRVPYQLAAPLYDHLGVVSQDDLLVTTTADERIYSVDNRPLFRLNRKAKTITTTEIVEEGGKKWEVTATQAVDPETGTSVGKPSVTQKKQVVKKETTQKKKQYTAQLKNRFTSTKRTKATTAQDSGIAALKKKVTNLEDTLAEIPVGTALSGEGLKLKTDTESGLAAAQAELKKLEAKKSTAEASDEKYKAIRRKTEALLEQTPALSLNDAIVQAIMSAIPTDGRSPGEVSLTAKTYADELGVLEELKSFLGEE
jgi:hypothetical protein